MIAFSSSSYMVLLFEARHLSSEYSGSFSSTSKCPACAFLRILSGNEAIVPERIDTLLYTADIFIAKSGELAVTPEYGSVLSSSKYSGRNGSSDDILLCSINPLFIFLLCV